ncbi:MAG: D-alanyl-D-alanine carboxypeptidase/D-alanyl-D-alanine-endopeptidase [Sulfuricellaceae bacterium]|nr:D-alanyl-D-alanine carboxypeptidase/D-alanyl-D-alanine-endopeptidase [Sulfuricellaceae bacterium]
MLPLSAGARGYSLPPEVAAALKQAHIPLDGIGVYVRDISQAKPLLDIGGDWPMSPASTMKLLTTYAGLELLGPAYTWKTEVYADGPVSGGVLHGNLIFKGYGDPDLTLERFWLLLRQLRQQGLHRIDGDLVLDKSYFDISIGDPGTFDGEPYKTYNVAPEALLIGFQAIAFRFWTEDGNVRIAADPSPESLHIVNHVQTGGGDCGAWRDTVAERVSSGPQGVTVEFTGLYPAACGEQSRVLSLFRNGDYIHSVFQQLWQELGGEFQGRERSGSVDPGARLLASLPSVPLAEAVRDINKYSNNTMARDLFLTLGADTISPPGTLAKSNNAVHCWLAAKGLDFPELVLENGSGLSRTERISARHLGELLVSAYHSPVMPEYVSSLPISARDGTMKKRLREQWTAGMAHIKTGTLDGVKAIGGYLQDQQGRQMAVVFLINHAYAAGGGKAQDALLDWLYRRP